MNLKLLLCCLLLPFSLAAQTPAADSLSALLRDHPQPDTIRINLLNALTKELFNRDPETNRSWSEDALRLARQLRFPKVEAFALFHLGYTYHRQGNYPRAQSYYESSRSIFDRLGAHEDLSLVLYYMGHAQLELGNYAQALTLALQSQESATLSGRPLRQVYSQNLLGNIFAMVGDYAKALSYQLAALREAERLGDQRAINIVTNGVGETYRLQGQYAKAIPYYERNFQLSQDLLDPYNQRLSEGNLADVYGKQAEYQKSISYGLRALSSFRTMGDVGAQSWLEGILAHAHLNTNQPDSALFYGRQSLQKAQQVGGKESSRDASQVLLQLYRNRQDYPNAFRYQHLYYAYKDSLLGEETARHTALLEYNADLETKQSQIVLLTKDRQLQAEASTRQRQLLYGLLGGLGLVLVLAGVLMRNNRNKQRANALLEKQKTEIDGQARRLEGLNEEMQAINQALAHQTQQITQQRDTLAQSYRNVELLGEVGKQITANLSVETIIATVYQNVNGLMEATVFGIGLYNESRQCIDFPATYEKGQRLPFYANSLSDQDRLDVWCFHHNQEVLIGDYQREYSHYIGRIQQPKAGETAQSVIYLPLVIKERVIGVITVQSFALNAYSDYHLYILRNLALYTAIALENAEAYQQLNQNLVKLTSTQNQLVQAEKMASLGELTAGIAHEIQNPLNFVTNFSEVSQELVEELREDLGAGRIQGAVEITGDLEQNLRKIHHHGQRADAIVKNMLQHSRASAGEVQLINFNALADEFLRLAYHGLRAKDKSFNAALVTNFDPDLGKVEVVPQELGRVLLNLFHNAFYAVQQKTKLAHAGAAGYKPTVHVTTRKVGDQVDLRVRDNEIGIPEAAKSKIFQPFFTTKPTGEGTGLGLSLSYDIVTKGHSGELQVESVEGEYAEFILRLPLKTPALVQMPHV
ncbi:hypothetical protein BH24BAC1_BH24BAC1_19990 [soil metagenome]